MLAAAAKVFARPPARRALFAPKPSLRAAYTTAAEGSKGGRVFETTQDKFDDEVLDSPVPTVVDFYAEWCQPCKILGPIISKAVEKDGRVNLAKVNVDENLELARDYKITSLPTVVAFRDGEPTSAFIGMRPPAAIEQFIKEAAEGKQ
ncbi:hypothetical protein GGI12_000755 [Dipsacomyces acuminosporus]|nr:hypothetical protein GGI12_000755 [Dipsacomyces acuminosporus]